VYESVFVLPHVIVDYRNDLLQLSDIFDTKLTDVAIRWASSVLSTTA